MPTVLFIGAKDIMLHSYKTARRLGRWLQQAEINIIAEGGHSNVNDVNKIIGWLKSE